MTVEKKNAIEIQQLTKRYGAKTAVDHLSLEVGEGELFALLGVNGAGKSTAIRMLCGLSRPDEGDALLSGHSVVRESALVKAAVGVSPQESAVAPNLTVRENLLLMARLSGLSRTEAEERAEETEKTFSLSAVSKQKAKTLSGGWQRRLSIAMAVIGEPEILFLDEPTLGLDILARRELWEYIKGLKGKRTVILTTHYLEEAETLADRIAVLREGRLVAVGTAAELIKASGKANFEDAFVALAADGLGGIAE